MRSNDNAGITGASGFIGGHFVRALRKQGYARVRPIDVDPLDGSAKFVDVISFIVHLGPIPYHSRHGDGFANDILCKA